MIDRAHRIFKPPHIPADKPRDVLLLTRSHFFQTRRFLQHQNPCLPSQIPYGQLAIYSAMAQKRDLAPITKILQQHSIPYKWGFPIKLFFFTREKFPIKLTITYQGKTTTILHLKQGLKRLHNWGLIPTPESGAPTQRAAKFVHGDWRAVTNK